MKYCDNDSKEFNTAHASLIDFSSIIIVKGVKISHLKRLHLYTFPSSKDCLVIVLHAIQIYSNTIHMSCKVDENASTKFK